MNLNDYQTLLTTDISDALEPGCAMDVGIRSLWRPTPKIMGIAYTVKCENHSNTHLHDAIYSASKGAIIVCESDANDYAVAGGNVCAVAQENGIAGFIIDGCVRDIGEIRERKIPVFARGIFPKPGSKKTDGSSKADITCGGLSISTGDLIAADEEGIVVVRKDQIEPSMQLALQKKEKAEAQSLADWRSSHEKKIKSILS